MPHQEILKELSLCGGSFLFALGCAGRAGVMNGTKKAATIKAAAFAILLLLSYFFFLRSP
jgi:hypothetical protein